MQERPGSRKDSPPLPSSSSTPAGKNQPLSSNAEKSANRRNSIQQSQQHLQVEKVQSQYQRNKRSNSGSSSASSLHRIRNDLHNGSSPMPSNPTSLPEDDARSVISTTSSNTSRPRGMSSPLQSLVNPPSSPRSRSASARGAALKGPSSPPSTPRLSSRSRILASSAALVDGVATPPLPYAYRTKSTDSEAEASIHAESSNRAHVQSLPHINRRLPSSPPTFLQGKESLASATGGLSLAERKKRLASASGDGSSFGESKAEASVSSSPPPVQRQESEAGTSRSSTKESGEAADKDWAEVMSKEGSRDESDDTKSISGKSGLRRRISELRDNLFGEGQNTATLPSTSPDSKATTYAKDEVPSSFSASIDGRTLQQSHLEVPSMRSRPSLRSQQSQTSTQESDGGSVDARRYVIAQEAPGMEPTASEDTSHSWITSLSSVSPPDLPDFNGLRFNVPLPDSPVNEKLSPPTEEGAKQLQRTSSWPPDEQRRGSFVSIKGNGLGTGYRFENASNQAKRSPTLERGILRSPNSTKSVDLLRSIDSKERDSSDRSNPQSPSMLEFNSLFIPPSRRSNSGSSSQWDTPRLPVIAMQNSSAVIDEDGEHENVSSPVAIVCRMPGLPRYNRSGSIHSINSQPTSPVHHTPRSSSLILGGGNRSPVTPTRSASSRNSYMTVHSSSAVHDEHNASVNIKDMIQRRDERKRSVSSPKATGSGSSSGADALGLTNTIEETPSAFYDFGSSPMSMMTAPQTSSQMSVLGVMNEEVIEPASAPSEIGILTDEPKRPSRNPLRSASSSHSRSRNWSDEEGTSLVAAAEAAQGRRMTSPMSMSDDVIQQVRHEEKKQGAGGTGSSESTGEHTPLYKTTQEVVQLSSADLNDTIALNDQLDHTDVTKVNLASAKSESRLGGEQTSQSLESAIQLEEKGRKFDEIDEDEGDTRNSVVKGTASSQEDEETTTLASPASSLTLASPEKQTSSHRKAAPSRLTNAFHRDKTGDKMRSPDVMSPVSPGNSVKSKRMRMWPFGKENVVKESPLALLQVDSKEANKASKASKMSKTIRSSKRDTDQSTASRPAITRVYKDATLMDCSIEPGESGDELENDAESIVTTQEGQSPAMKSFDHSVPGTPIALNEEMTPEIKRIVQRRNVIRELVETEKSYAADLIVVRDIYLAKARIAVGLNLGVPLSGYNTPPLSSSDLVVSINGNIRLSQTGSSGKPSIARNFQKSALNDFQSPSASPQTSIPNTKSLASPASLAASSSVPSNRSSTYTVSSQTSQTSDTSFMIPSSNAPPLPSTPPNLAGLSTPGSASTVQSHSPSSSAHTATMTSSRTAGLRPKMAALNTTGNFLTPSGESPAVSDNGLTLSDVRIIFAHLEASCSFAEDTASVFAGCMGSFARAKRIKSGDVKAEMEKGDDRLGEAFLNLMARIRMNFIEYCSRHEYSMQRLQAVSTSSAKANTLLKECTEVARRYTNAWDLASLLIKPVQRVLKYPLLLQQILSCTPKSHADYANLQHALEDMQSVADEINRVKKRRDLADHLITGRVKEVGKSDSSPSPVVNSLKGKRRSDAKTLRGLDGSMAALRAEDAALEQYTSLTEKFYSLMEGPRNLQEQCLEWSACLRESYNGQINVLLAMRRIYRLRVDEEGEDGEIKTREIQRSDHKDAIKLIKAYIKLLLNILETSWQQADDAIRSEIVPMTMQISKLFESPRSVMVKRDDRLADYQKLRQMSQNGKQLDRKVSDNALGFVALNAQLVEDLPRFLVGVQSLLDASVRKFANIQAIHFGQVRQTILDFWRDKAKRIEEIAPSSDGSGQPSIRHVNITKAFWDRHSVPAAWIDSLSIGHRRKASYKGAHLDGEEDDSIGSSAVSTPGANSISQATSSTVTSHEMKKSFSKRSVTASIHSHSTHSHDDNSMSAVSASRSYPSKPGLMRSISGPIAKKKSAELLPPLPLVPTHKQGAPNKSNSYAASIASTSSKRGRHNDLTYQQFKDKGKLFIQLNPIPFLDADDEVKRTPLELVESSSGQTNGTTSRRTSRSSSQQSIPQQFQRQRLDVIGAKISKVDVFLPPLEERRWHQNWPFINFAKGDVLQVLHSEDVNAESVHFGRIERSGDIGWAYARCFQEKTKS